jgi:hypothetical protein
MVVVLTSLSAAFAWIPGTVLPALQSCTSNPIARVRIEIFVYPRNDAAILAAYTMALSVGLQYPEVISFFYDVLFIIVE